MTKSPPVSRIFVGPYRRVGLPPTARVLY